MSAITYNERHYVFRGPDDGTFRLAFRVAGRQE